MSNNTIHNMLNNIFTNYSVEDIKEKFPLFLNFLSTPSREDFNIIKDWCDSHLESELHEIAYDSLKKPFLKMVTKSMKIEDKNWIKSGKILPDFFTFGGHRRFSTCNIKKKFFLIT